MAQPCEKNVILIDYFSFTSKIHKPQDIKEILGLENEYWEDLQGKGAKGYKNRWYFNCISIHYDGNNQTTWTELTGQGCRAFENFGNGNFINLINLIKTNRNYMNLTRIDIAYDDHKNILPIKKIASDTLSQNYLSPFRSYEVINSNKGISLTIGSHKSDALIRIYDKAAERNIANKHWIRVELQLRDENAYQYAIKMLNIPPGELYKGVIFNYLRYVEPNKTESNRSRWQLTKYWSKFLFNAERIKIYKKPGVDYNKEKLDRYVYGQAGQAIFTAIMIDTTDEFIDRILTKEKPINRKYYDLISSLSGEKYNESDK